MAASIPKTEAPAYTDLAGLSKLKHAAGNNDPTAIRTVAEQFEAMFTRMMLKSMRDASGPDPLFGSDQEQMYQGMADDQLSVQLAKGKGLGLADMLVRQLTKLGVKGADAAARGGSGPTASSSAGSGASAGTATLGAGSAAAKAAAAYNTTADTAKTTFVQDLWPQAQEAGRVLGVDPRHLIAQAALETNWGRNVPQDSSGRCSNNLFGIKASADWAGAAVTSPTQEFNGGVSTNTTAQFKAYDTTSQSFQDYVALLSSNPRYSGALNTGGNTRAFAAGLQRGGYATDPDYANKITAIAGMVANRLNNAPAQGIDVSDLKLSSAVPITASTGAL